MAVIRNGLNLIEAIRKAHQDARKGTDGAGSAAERLVQGVNAAIGRLEEIVPG